jgi:hypothetical protein
MVLIHDVVLLSTRRRPFRHDSDIPSVYFDRAGATIDLSPQERLGDVQVLDDPGLSIPSSFGALGFLSPYVVFDGSLCVTFTALTPHVIISTTALSAAYFMLGMVFLVVPDVTRQAPRER